MSISVSFYIYLIFYVTAMVAVFGLSLVMLLPRTRVAFKAPVPHIHNVLGKLFIPWGMTYLIFLPSMYMQITGDERIDFYYTVTYMVTALLTISVISWAYMAYLQQGVRQKVLQPLILLVPTILAIGYIITSSETLLFAFNGIFTLEWMLLVGYYVVLYRRFAYDLKTNYSSISQSMLHGLHMQWIVSALTLVIFTLCVTFDTLFWNSIDILANVLAICVFVYTSEHMMPIPEKGKNSLTIPKEEKIIGNGKVPTMNSEHSGNTLAPSREYEDTLNLAEALHNKCEMQILFCNPDLTLADLALAVGTNRTYLGEWFTENGTTFYHYINMLRVRHAASLLTNTDCSIKQIQTDSGFSNRTTFSKYFQKYYGCSPTEYRKKA